jgi:uncharacterized membrane protein
MSQIIAWLAAAGAFLALDLLWLGVVARNFYWTQLGDLVRDKPDLGVAALFYAGYVAGVVFFAIMPALQTGGVWRAVLLGALLGLFGYGTYDLTNLATLKGYPPLLAAVDIAWGTFLTAAASAAGFLAVQRFAAGS